MALNIIQKYKDFIDSDRSTRKLYLGYAIDGFLKRIIAVIFGIPLIAVLYLLKIFISIKIGLVDTSRIGHLLSPTELFLREQYFKNFRSREISLFVCQSPPANRQALIMIQRKITLIESTLLTTLFRIIKRYIPWGPWINLDLTGAFGCKASKAWRTAPVQLSFTKTELKQGEDFLQSMGIASDNPFICFSSRDSIYMEKMVPSNKSMNGWSYHNFRNSDINNYLSSADFVTSQGMWALRMGAAVEKSLKTNNPKIIDYAVKFRTEFADMYLLKNCKFFLGDTAGILIPPAIFNVPIVMVNMVPFGLVTRNFQDLVIPKKYWNIERKRFLTFPEIFAIGADWWGEAKLFVEAGIEVIENTPEEILAVVKEMLARLNGAWVARDGDEELQQRYHNSCPSDHWMKAFISRMGSDFLRQNEELLGHVKQTNFI